MKIRYLTGIALSALIGTSTVQAATMSWKIDFDNAPVTSAGDIVNGLMFNLGGGVSVTITATQPDGVTSKTATIFDTDDPTGNDADLAASFTTMNGAETDPKNVLILQDDRFACGTDCVTTTPSSPFNGPNDEANRPAGNFLFTFASTIPGTMILIDSIDFYDVEPVGEFDLNKEILIDGAMIAIVPNTGGNNKGARRDLGGQQLFATLTIQMPGSGAIDNIRGRFVKVPEPETLSLLLITLGIFFAANRFTRGNPIPTRRRRS